ncbi:unnamed protein product [Thlaspi arvense]|uniref:Uncharacterized protein n=1 Tax=Thlaspi arvense TaxID=13288 RepID=A0AAU9RS95_THLAR|nr:unnamed protein product [Thlaspi arvense]
MNATKFVVLLIFVGAVCAINVGTRMLEEAVPQEAKLGISVPKTATTITNGLGAELARVVVSGSATHYSTSTARAAEGPGRSDADGTGSTYSDTYGYVIAEGPKRANAYINNGASGNTGAAAAVGPGGATGTGIGNGGAGTNAGGSAN